MERRLSFAYSSMAGAVKNGEYLNFTNRIYFRDIIDNLDNCIEQVNNIDFLADGCFSNYPLGYKDVLDSVQEYNIVPQIKSFESSRGKICYLEHQLKKFAKNPKSLSDEKREELSSFLHSVNESLNETGGTFSFFK